LPLWRQDNFGEISILLLTPKLRSDFYTTEALFIRFRNAQTRGVTVKYLSDGEIERRKQFLTRLWNLEELERPAFQIDIPLAFIPDSEITMYERFHDPQKMLERQLQEFRLKANIKDDYIPALHPYLGTGVFASAFGCKIRWFENENPWAIPIIDKDPSRVYDLQPPADTDGLLGRVLEFTEYFRTATHGEFPIRMTDLQSPLDTASLIWRYEDFLVAMITHPREVHHLLNLVTELIIRFVKKQREVSQDFIPVHYPFVWLPDGKGIAVSEDIMALIPEYLYREFAVPYNNRLAEEFGGLIIHSCGNITHCFPALKDQKNLWGINFGATETPFPGAVEALSGKTVLIPHLGLNKDIHYDDVNSYLKAVLDTRKGNSGLLILVSPYMVDMTKPQTRGLLSWKVPAKLPEKDLQSIYSLIHGSRT